MSQEGGGKITPTSLLPAYVWNREMDKGVCLWLFLNMATLWNNIFNESIPSTENSRWRPEKRKCLFVNDHFRGCIVYTKCRVTHYITGSAVALRCCNAHGNRKIGNSTPCKIVTPENIKLNFACVIMSESWPTMQILVSIGALWSSPQIREILPPLTFWLSCPVLSFFSIPHQVEPQDRFSRFMTQTSCFRARMVLLGVRTTVSYTHLTLPTIYSV